MKTIVAVCAAFLAAVPNLAAQGFDFSGVLDTKLSLAAGAGDSRDFSFGLEEYANLRLSAKTGGPADFYAAVNLIALSGTSLETAAAFADTSASFLAAGGYYGALLEIERLYMRVSGKAFDLDLGLFRQAFGFGQVWSPVDFLNPKNPLAPDARPKPALGASCSFYPADNSKLTAFAVSPENPFNADGSGFLAGFAGNLHLTRADMEALYGYETPQDGSPQGLHRFGLSLRTDLLAQFTFDALYTLNPDADNGADGLAASASADYSFLDGDLYLAAAYLFSGSPSASSLPFQNNNYLYGSALYRFTDYTSAALAAVVCLDDLSFQPVITAETELFQGFTLSLQAAVPLDADTLTGSGSRGELGPVPPDASGGSRFTLTLKARFRF